MPHPRLAQTTRCGHRALWLIATLCLLCTAACGDPPADTPDAGMMVDLGSLGDMGEDTSGGDTTPPVVMLDGAGGIEYISHTGEYTLSGQATDDVGVVAIEHVELPYTTRTPIAHQDGRFNASFYLGEGSATVRVIARDAAGNEGFAEADFEREPPPAIIATFTVSGTLEPLQPVTFDASGTESLLDAPLVYHWRISAPDGRQVTTRTSQLTHVFAQEGAYTVTLIVRSEDGVYEDYTSQEITIAAPADLGEATLHGEVVDDAHSALVGVGVFDASGAQVATTDAQGRYEAQVARGRPVVLTLRRSDYTEQVVRLELAEDATEGYAASMMQRREDPLYLDDAAAGGEIVGAQGARLVFPPDALIDAESGQPVTGTVAVLMTPVDMSAARTSQAFPGEFRGLVPETGEAPNIASHGVVEVELVQDGRRLQIAPGKTVTLDIPSPAAAEGERVPLWSLDPATARWRLEGEGVVVSSASGNVLRAEVGHFSWWNSDVVLGEGYVDGALTLTSAGQPWSAAGAPRVSIIAPQTPRRDLHTRLRAAVGDAPVIALPVPAGLEIEVEAIDARDGALYYGLDHVTFTPDATQATLDLKPVGGAGGPALHTMPEGAAQAFDLPTRGSARFFEITLADQEQLRVQVTSTGAQGRLVLRDAQGAPLAEQPFHSGAGSGVMLASPPRAGTYFVQVRPEDGRAGGFEIVAERVQTPSIAPGQVLTNQTLPAGEQRRFTVQANRGQDLVAMVFNSALTEWRINAESPTGQVIGLLARAYQRSSQPSVVLSPKRAPRANGFRLILSSFDLSTTARGFSIVFGKAQRMLGEFTDQPYREVTGTLKATGDAHFYDVRVRQGQHVLITVQNHTDTPLVVGGSGSFEGTVYIDATTRRHLIRTQIFRASNDGVWIMPRGEVVPGAPISYTVSVEAVSGDQTTARVGDPASCPGATIRSAALAASALVKGGTLELCAGEHLLLDTLSDITTVRGLGADRAATTLRMVDDSYGEPPLSISSQAPTTGPITIERLTMRSVATAIDISSIAPITLRDLALQQVDPDVSSSANALSIRGNGAAGALEVEGLRMDDWPNGLRVVGERDVTLRDVTFESALESGDAAIRASLSSGDLMISNLRVSPDPTHDIRLSSGVTLDVAGSVIVEGALIRQASTSPALSITSAGAALPTQLVVRDSALLMTNTSTSTSTSVYEPLKITLMGSEQDVLVERNRMGTTNTTSQTRGMRLATSGTTTLLTATVRSNVLWGFRLASIMPNMDRFARAEIVHNSVWMHDPGPSGAFDLDSASAASVVFQNNAIASDTPSTAPGVRLGPSVTLSGGHNLLYQLGDAYSRPANASAITGDLLGVDPLWTSAWDVTDASASPLLPTPGSPLIDAGEAHTSSPTTDLRGQPSPAGARVDIGAYEQ